MTTDIENRIEFRNAGQEISQLVGVLPERLLLVQEFRRHGIALEHLDRRGVEGSLATLGGGDGELDLLMKDLPRMGELGLGLRIRPARSTGVHGGVIHTRYHPVEWSRPGIWAWEVRTTSTLGAILSGCVSCVVFLRGLVDPQELGPGRPYIGYGGAADDE